MDESNEIHPWCAGPLAQPPALSACGLLVHTAEGAGVREQGLVARSSTIQITAQGSHTSRCY